MKPIYALYKGEDLITIGTIDELSKHQKVKKETIYFYMSPAHKKRDRGNRKVVVRIGEE